MRRISSLLPYCYKEDMQSTKVTIKPHLSPSYQKVASQSKVIYSHPHAVYSPSECVLPMKYKDDLHRILDLEIREDDVWIVTYPKCGTTWTQEMVWLLMNNLDFKKASEADIMQRSPFIEFASFMIPMANPVDWIDALEKEKSPRCAKSHLPKDLLPRQFWTKKPKIVYVARNPKDVILSYFYHHKNWMAYSGSFETYADAFLDDSLLYGPFWKHILDFWDIKEPHVLFNTYEEMKQDLPAVIRKTAKFLNKNLTDEQVSKLALHLSFSSMKDNPSVNYKDALKPLHEEHNMTIDFMRKGESGAWKEDLPADIVARVDAWSEKYLAKSDFPFYRK